MDPTRRDLVVGAGAMAALTACGGDPAPAPEAPATAPKAPKKAKRPPKPPPASRAPEGSTLFLPHDPPEGEAPKVWTDRPEWLRRAPGIYLPTAVTSGAGSLCFAEQERYALPTLVKHFSELPRFLDDARKLGTNVLYIVDVYQGPADWAAPRWRLWKEDYRARDDLGGPKALRAAIDAIHKAGGRVVLYLSGFAINRESALGKAKGRGWSILHGNEPISEPYPDYYMPCPQVKPWQDHLVEVVKRYAGEYGADGVHVDSYGNQKNWRCDSADHGHDAGDRQAFNSGCQHMLERLRAAMREHVEDAVVLCEADKLSRLFKRGLDGAQSWGIHELQSRWSWNQAGNTSIYTAGWSLDDMHQIVALGHKWMLAPYWLERPEHPTAAAWMAKEHPKPKTKGDDKHRRMFCERYYRGLHKYRNAGLLLGKRMPGLDDLTARRWLEEARYASPEAMLAHVDALRSRAPLLDDALGGAEDLPAPTAHVKRVMDARARLSPLIDDGATVSLLTSVAGKGAAYLWDGPKPVIALVNVSDDAITLDLGARKGAFVDEIDGKTVALKGPASCPAHSLRLLRPA